MSSAEREDAGAPSLERITSYAHDGLSFDVLDDGPLDGVPVVLLHGFPERASTWRDVAPLLHARGFRTLAPDQRGYSPGARPARRRDYRVSRLTGDIVALVERVGGPVHLVGHDWGAFVAWDLATRRPDLVRTLTAVSVPHPRAYLRALLGSDQALRSWYMLFFQLPRLPELTARKGGGRFDQLLVRAGMTPAEVARFRREVVEYGALTGGLNWYRAMFHVDRSVVGRKVSVPTTHVWSTEDSALTRRGAELTRRHVTGPYRFEVLLCTHWIPTQEPARLARIVLDRISSEVSS